MAINEYLNGAGRDTIHDEFEKLSGNVEEGQGVSDERPLNSVKGFFQINFKHHVTRFAFHLQEVRNDFLDHDGMITGSSLGQEATLTLPNEV